MSEIYTLLEQRFDGAHAGDLDATVEFNWHNGHALVGIRDGQATFYQDLQQPNAPAPDLIIYFRDEQQTCDIVSGQANPIDAFMQGDFRSNGHIVWVFQTLSAFSRQTELPGLSGD